MIGLGTLINGVAIILGGIIGILFGRFLKESFQNSLNTVCGVSTMFLGISGALEGMLTVEGSTVTGGKGVFIIICMVLGAVVGELLNIEKWFETFGIWLRKKTGNTKDPKFVDGFLTATFTVCIGAMAIIGSISDGLTGDYSILLAKSILDLIIVMVFSASMGKGPLFSFIPVVVLQGMVTILARVIQPILTDEALGNLSMIGSILIFCVGINLVWGKKVKVANLLPAIIFAVLFAFIPIKWQ